MKVKYILKFVSVILVVALFSTILTPGFYYEAPTDKNINKYISNEPTFENTELENSSIKLTLAYDKLCEVQKSSSQSDIVESVRSLKGQTQQYIDSFAANSEQISSQINDLDDSIMERHNEYEKEVKEKSENLIEVLDSIINQNINTDKNLLNEELEKIDKYFTSNDIKTTSADSVPNAVQAETPSVINADDSQTYQDTVGVFNTADTVTDTALSETDETHLTDEIKQLADELKTPLNVYNYLKNHINYEPYYGSRKGAIATFESNAGNDVDQASLLIAMLRYLNYPAKYVTGTVILDKETACGLTYTDKIENAANILAASGRPTSLINDNGKINSVQIEQTWVEAYVPYTDYRGAGNNSGEKLWISLDTSIKEYEKVNSVYDDLEKLGITQNEYDTAAKNNNLNEYLNNIEVKVNDYYKDKEVYLVSKKIKEEYLEYLPLSTQYTIKSIDSTYDSIENNKCDKIIFSVNGKQITEQKALTLYGKRLIIEYIPETDNDQAVIDKYGSIFNAPAYLVKMVPVFKLDGEVIGKGQAVSLGSSQKFTMRVYSDNTYRSVDNTITAGSVYQITEDMQNMTEAELTAAMNSAKDISESINTDNVYSDEYLGKILDFAGKMYFAQVDIADNALAEKTNISATRSLSVGMTGYSVKVYNSWGYPVGINEGSLYIDIDLNVLMAVSRDGNNEDALKYMLTSGIVSSNYESIIWEELTGEESISTINLLSNAIDENQNVYMLCSKNYEQAKNELCLSSTVEAEIASAIHQGKIVLLHDKEMTIGDWNGYGYIITDPDTGSAAYMISGGLNGGSTSTSVSIAYLVEMCFVIYDCYQLYTTIISIVGMFMAGSIVTGLIFSAITAVVACFVFYNFYHTMDLMKRYIDGDEEAGQELKGNMWTDIVFAAGSKLLGSAAKNISKVAASKNITKHVGSELSEKLLKESSNPSKLSSAIKKLSKSGFSDDTIKFIAENTGESGILWAKRQAKNGIKNEIIEQIARNADDCTKYTDELERI